MNDYVEKIRKLVGTIPSSVCSARSNGSLSRGLDSFLRIEGKSQIVSQSETHLELGHPSVSSASLTLGVCNRDMISDGRITSAGSALEQIEKGRHPFAQIVLVGGADLKPEHLPKLRRAASAVGQLSGCMARQMEEKIWVRISSEALRKGFSFRLWGEHLIQTVRKTAPAVESVEVIFLVGMDDQVKEIMKLAGAVGEKRREELLERVKERTGKDYDCDNPYDCDDCPDKPDCDVLKDAAEEVRERTLQAVASKKGEK